MAIVAQKPNVVFSAELSYKTRTTALIERFARNHEFPHNLELRLKPRLEISVNCGSHFKIVSLVVSNFHSGEYKGSMTISALKNRSRYEMKTFQVFLTEEVGECCADISGAGLTYVKFSNRYVLDAKSQSELYFGKVGTFGSYAVLGAMMFKS